MVLDHLTSEDDFEHAHEFHDNESKDEGLDDDN